MHTGGCLCGGVRFRVDAALEPIQICHCSQCRKAQGTPFATNTPVASAAFRWLAGADLLSTYRSSPDKERVFCSRCGSPIYSRRDSVPGVLRLRAGLLDGDLSARPAAHHYTGSKANWWTIDDDLPRFDGPA
ncbi:MAG: GFA family protein [Xanthomonadaceae bacterium]|nr:GFA family protein [Xanthomonadaceae bacterium]